VWLHSNDQSSRHGMFELTIFRLFPSVQSEPGRGGMAMTYHARLRSGWCAAQTSVRMWMQFMIICPRLRKSAMSLSMSSTSLISEREARACHLGRG
jgi:hypothetical protein